MTRKLLLPALAIALLGGCATSAYQYRGGQGDYYYGQPSVEYRNYGAPYGGLYGYPGYGYSPFGYYGSYGYYGTYGYPYRYGTPYRPPHRHRGGRDGGGGHDRGGQGHDGRHAGQDGRDQDPDQDQVRDTGYDRNRTRPPWRNLNDVGSTRDSRREAPFLRSKPDSPRPMAPRQVSPPAVSLPRPAPSSPVVRGGGRSSSSTGVSQRRVRARSEDRD